MTKIFKPERIDIKLHPEINEKIIQDIIANDPSIIGLGDLVLKDKERMQPRAGRLDLLLFDPETTRRYEVEIQLGKTDESHVIRTIEYWDIERKRYPQYDHCAVIIAEDITSRFLNIVSLFNGFIPLIAIQMNAYKFGDQLGLVFTKVLDEMPLGLIDDDEDTESDNTKADRDYWIKRSSSEVINIFDKIVETLNSVEGGYVPQYLKGRVILQKNGQRVPYVIFRLRKKDHVLIVLKLEKDQAVDALIESNDLEALSYNVKDSKYRIRITMRDVKEKSDAIRSLFSIANKKYQE
jgi:hypothetical protein